MNDSLAGLLLLIGLPGSGKSTWATKTLDTVPGGRLISTDHIRADLFGNEAVQGPWLLVWREVQRRFQQAVIQISQAQLQYVIYDATNTARRQRRRVLDLARAVGFAPPIGIWFDPPLAVCLARNAQRDRNVPEEIIFKMQRQLQGAPPHVNEGFRRLYHIDSNRNNLSFNMFGGNEEG